MNTDAFSRLVLFLGPEERRAVYEACEKRDEKKRQQAEESKARTGRAIIPYDDQAPTTPIGFLKKTLDVERIKQSVAKVLRCVVF